MRMFGVRELSFAEELEGIPGGMSVINRGRGRGALRGTGDKKGPGVIST
jgi:hypothetical protein